VQVTCYIDKTNSSLAQYKHKNSFGVYSKDDKESTRIPFVVKYVPQRENKWKDKGI
jgi:hypothetical protein